MSTSGERRFNALVVEDSPPMRKMIVFALSRVRELDVVEADDGVDALRRQRRHAQQCDKQTQQTTQFRYHPFPKPIRCYRD